jgi:aminoglycoside phosphotransferase (APT) family kinase protein
VTESAHLTPLATGREAEVFVRRDGAVVKVWRSGMPEWRVEREAAALRALAGGRHLAPEFLETTEVDGRPALVCARVEGDDLLTRLSRRPWLFLRVAGCMGRAHRAMHELPGPTSLPDLHRELGQRIESAPALPRRLASAGLELLGSLPSGDRLCHGDFHPGNMLGSLDAPVVIDWGDASRGSPAADVARTLVLLRLGEPPEGMARWMRALTASGRRLLARRYLRVYRRLSSHDLSRLSDWVFVRTAARFAEEIEVEYPRLVSLLERHHR